MDSHLAETMTKTRAARRPKASAPPEKSAPAAIRDAERAREDILAIATEEFARKGLAGARVDEIAARTHTVKRMIYYYFGSKEGLYRAVLARCYDGIRSIESAIDVDALGPEEALRELVRATFDYHNEHSDFVRLVMNENIHHGEHIAHLPNIKATNSTVIKMLRKILQRGVEARLFRRNIDPIDLHMSISALAFYNVSNRYTFSHIFEKDMMSPKALEARRELVVETIERWCRADG
jgi:AcrR family transcriptional regulator